MDKFPIWLDFIDNANEILKQGQNIDEFKSNIQIIFEPSFSNHIFLQLNWEHDTVKWYRTTWEKIKDIYKINDPIENLKYIGQEMRPTFIYENGEIDISLIRSIVDLLRCISIKPQIDKYGGITLDGSYYTLIFGVESFQAIYKWHSISEEWKELQEIADLLLDLNDKLK